MIEQIMYFTLGVLIATLVALLVLPAVWHRAVRLTTRRVEAAVPISIFEVQADKDQQRAFFALNQRRLELQADAMRETVVAHAADIETQRQRIFDLESALAELTTRHDLFTATGAERDVLLGETQDQLADRTAAVAQLEAELGTRSASLSALEEAHRQLEADAQGLAATLKMREATLATESERIAALESEVTTLGANLAGTARRLDETSALLEAERNAAAEAKAISAEAVTHLTTDLGETQVALALKSAESQTRAETIAVLEAERDRLSAGLGIAERDLDASRAVVHAFEQRRAHEFAAAETENRRLADTLHMLKADHALMEDAMRRPRREGVEAGDTQAISAEGIAALRESVSDVAARLVALTARLEGPGSPIHALLEDGGASGLAGRIRTLLDDAGPTPESEIVDETGEQAPSVRPRPKAPNRAAAR